jgi:hypothetical protein
VLQNVAAKRAERQEGTADALLAVRLLRDLPYLAGTALDGLGFLLSLLALRQLPVVAVQAGVAGSIGVTAILAAVVFGERLIRQGWALAFGAIGLGTFASALQQGTVTTVAAVVVVAETIAPTLVGIALLGDRARPGLGAVAVLAFIATVVGAWVLTTADPGRTTKPAESDGAGAASPRPESREGA